VEVVASLSQGRTAAAQCGLFTHKSVPVIFEPPCIIQWSVPQTARFISVLRINKLPFSLLNSFMRLASLSNLTEIMCGLLKCRVFMAVQSKFLTINLISVLLQWVIGHTVNKLPAFMQLAR